MFERFTDRARRVVVLAQEESRLLNHHYIGTEHLLLGLLAEGEGLACQALTSMGISLPEVRRQVQEIIGRGSNPPTGHIPFTPRAKKVLELSLREALQLDHNYIGTEHILLGLIREGEGVAAQVLQKLGADLSLVRLQVVGVAEGETVPEEVPPQLRPASPSVAQAIAVAAQEAERDDDTEVASEHLLLALLRDKESLAGRMLGEFGVSEGRVRRLLDDIRSGRTLGSRPRAWTASEDEPDGPWLEAPIDQDVATESDDEEEGEGEESSGGPSGS
jgi:ATP-dependent Clp protease ATP-binding subunit ClpA